MSGAIQATSVWPVLWQIYHMEAAERIFWPQHRLFDYRYRWTGPIQVRSAAGPLTKGKCSVELWIHSTSNIFPWLYFLTQLQRSSFLGGSNPMSFPNSSCFQLRAKHQRPRVKVHGAWAFGYTLNVYVLDESAPHDSSAIIEIVAATIEDVALLCYFFFLVGSAYLFSCV